MLRVFLDTKYSIKQSLRHELSVNPFARFSIRGFSDEQSYGYLRENMFKKIEKLHLFNITDTAHNAEAILMPFEHSAAQRKSPEIEAHYRRIAEASSKPIIIVKFGDSIDDVDGNNVIILRTSKYRSTLLPNEIICPPVVSDLGTETDLTILTKTKRPSIGFVGLATKAQSNNSVRRFFRYGKQDYILSLLSFFTSEIGAHRSGLYFRSKALKILRENEGVDCDFIIRDFWGRRAHAKEHSDPSVLRAEFVSNIVQNLYTLCVKGAGNFSLRFFEVLSAGRIPLVIDTDITLPMNEEIDYKKFCIFIDQRDLSDIGSLLISRHSELVKDELEQMQRVARMTFHEKLRFDVFSKKLFSHTIPALIQTGTYRTL